MLQIRFLITDSLGEQGWDVRDSKRPILVVEVVCIGGTVRGSLDDDCMVYAPGLCR